MNLFDTKQYMKKINDLIFKYNDANDMILTILTIQYFCALTIVLHTLDPNSSFFYFLSCTLILWYSPL